jgi:hypothetical protein
MKMLRSVLAMVAVVLLCGTTSFAADNGRTEKFTIGPTCYTEFPTIDCGDFWVLNDWCETTVVMVRYDKEGNPVQAIRHLSVGGSTYYNSEDEAIRVEGLREHVLNRIRIEENILYGSGPGYRVVVPGEGIVFLNTGHWTYNLVTGEIIWIGGPHQAITGDAPALCEALKQ